MAPLVPASLQRTKNQIFRTLDCRNVLEANPGFTIILILFVSAGFVSVTLAIAIGLSCLFCLGMLIKNICCSKKKQLNHEALRESEESENFQLELQQTRAVVRQNEEGIELGAVQ